jgi:D-serine deaminase-like pyridoxal phosphate-dependent protein
MAILKLMLSEFSWHERYRVTDAERVMTPALVLYPEIVASNIARTLRLLDGNAERWRPHIKTAKLAYTLRLLVEHGVKNFKCATTLELLTACRNGAADVLVAYPVVGANASRVDEIAKQFPEVRISVLVENVEQVRRWQGSSLSIFLDINPGMNRTGVEQACVEQILGLVRAIREARLEFRGLHYYDGQYGGLEERERTAGTRVGYDQLLELGREIQRNGATVPEVVTAGTPTFPCSLRYQGFRDDGVIHRVSPGTIVYGDATSLAELHSDYGYAPAALVLTRVVSQPCKGMITCDAGHKTVSADAGVPTCVVVGHPELTPLSPSEEHLPIKVADTSPSPQIGETLFLLPRHVCPTVNNFDDALLVRDGKIDCVEKVSARGREAPLTQFGERERRL